METTLERHLANLGWQHVAIETTMIEMCALFVKAFDASAVISRLEGVGSDGLPLTEDCRRVLTVFLDHAESSGSVEMLRRPGSRGPFEALAALERLCGTGGK